MNELKKAINDFAVNTDFIDADCGRFSYVEDQTDDLTYPYSVFSFQPFSKSRDSGTRFVESVIQFSIYDNDSSSQRIGELTQMLTAIFDDCENDLIIENYNVLLFTQLFDKEFKDEDVWNSVIQYKIKLQLM